ncbi:MAG TPA: hypothetical protein VFS94_02375 [Gemmatimonadales bacterium]|nr:hypothetical protein [Gemmatimonadales bacterium]
MNGVTMLTTRSTATAATLALLVMACAPHVTPESMPARRSADLRASAAALYEAYGSALATPRREAIAGFYHADGALIVFNGKARRQTQAELRSRYGQSWTPPAYFTWDELRFDSIGPGEVLVTGGFKWQSTGQRDTVPYIYAALLAADDSGLAIVFEHETLRPGR